MLRGTVASVAEAGKPDAAYSFSERVVLLDQSEAPQGVNVATQNGGPIPGVTFSFDAASRTVTVRKPMVKIYENWSIEILK